MDHEWVGFTYVRTHQDGTAIAAFVFDRGVMSFQHRRRLGHRFNGKRLWNDFELLFPRGHCCNQGQCERNIKFNFSGPAMRSI